MHPAYRSDRPGTAPDCGMDLEPVYADESPRGEGTATPAVKLTPVLQQLTGVRVTTVSKSAGQQSFRLFGRVTADETRVYRINAGIAGYMRDVLPVTTGTVVKKDQLLATFSSPMATMPLQTFIMNVGAEERFQKAVNDRSLEGQALPSAAANVQQRIQQLQDLGMSLLQIDEVRRTRLIPEKVRILAPADGIVMTRTVSPGQKFERGMEFYTIADLSRVWIVADVFEKDSQYVYPGQTASVVLSSGQPQLTGKVIGILPQVDASSRTLKVRVEVQNTKILLRPDMFVDVRLDVVAPASLSVPVDSVLDSGLKKTVYVETAESKFEPRNVETGYRFGDTVEIVKGLSEGDKIAAQANFLLDSETRIQQTAVIAAKADPSAASGKDPVCGMALSRASAGLSREHNGSRYYFCSSRCQHKFDGDPSRYIHENTARDHQASASRPQS